MGTVYLAEDTHLGRRVAIKFPSISDSHDYRARFLREARAVSELSHPCIATLFDYGETDEGQPFLVMELAKGRPLSDLMQQGELSLSKAVTIVSDVASALAAAHARGVIHRDIKPSNIMIDDNGQVKVLDFGLAKQLNKELGGHSEPEARTLLSTDTRSGVVLGTPAYLSPEQAVAGEVDGRSDLFALGTLLYESITGRTPFSGGSFIEIAANVLHVEPSPPSKINPNIPSELDFITLKALAKKPNKRYQSAKEMIADLNEVKSRLEETSGQTLIRKTSPSLVATGKTLNNISQILQRPRIPILYILIGGAILIVGGALALRLARPSPHKPPAEAQRWYEAGTAALRDGAYFQASKALERSIAADDQFMLAHARLAEAYLELDYTDRAKDELLRVTSSKTVLSPMDSLYLDAVTAAVRNDFPKAVVHYNEMVQQATDAEKPYILVDLGRAHTNNGDTKKAITAYAEASERSPDYPTPFLLLGILYGRQSELPSALSSFGKAESIYQATGNVEGRAEVLFQRGALFNKLNRLNEAKAQLEQALQLARAGDNKSQEIKTLLQLNSVAVDLGEVDQAEGYLRQGLELAQSNGMETLSVRALNDQGNNSLISGDYEKADKYFSDALQLAVRTKALSNLARARASLASLRLRQSKPDEALQLVEPALSFYQQGGYRIETSSCLTIIARASRHKGDYDSALKGAEQLMQLGQQLNDQSQIASSHAEMGQVFLRQEKFSEALDHFNQADTFYTAEGVPRRIGYNLHSRAEALWRMGRFSEAKTFLEQSRAIADQPGKEIKQLSVINKLSLAEMALAEGRFADAKTSAEQVLAAAGTEFKNAVTSAKTVIGLAQAHAGAKARAKEVASEAVEIARQTNDPALLGAAQSALAEVLLIAGDFKAAADSALEARQTFARLGQSASEWQALLIAAQASRHGGDEAKAREYAVQARDIFAKLEQRWGNLNYQNYLNRPDVQRHRTSLETFSS